MPSLPCRTTYGPAPTGPRSHRAGPATEAPRGPGPARCSALLGDLLEAVEHALPVLGELPGLLGAVATVLGELDRGRVARRRQLVAHPVVVLGHVVGAGHRAVVGDLEEPA